VDPAHSFCSDDEADGVPRNMLVCGVLDLLTSAGHNLEADDRHLRMSLIFPGFRCTGGVVELVAECSDEGWAVAIRHGDREIRLGRLDVFDGVPRPRPDPRPSEPGAVPVRANLVHRRRAEDVVIGTPGERPDSVAVPVLAPGPEHYLSRTAPGVHGVRTLVEAGWQFSVLLARRATGRPAGGGLVRLGVAADLPTGVPLAAPLELCWPTEHVTGNRLRFGFDLVRADLPGEPLGTIEFFCAAPDLNPGGRL
jgi:hypothetical protein